VLLGEAFRFATLMDLAGGHPPFFAQSLLNVTAVARIASG